MMDSDSSFVWAVGISIPLELLCDIGLQSGLGPRCTRSIAVSSYLRCGELAWIEPFSLGHECFLYKSVVPGWTPRCGCLVELLPFPIRDGQVLCHNSSSLHAALPSSYIPSYPFHLTNKSSFQSNIFPRLSLSLLVKQLLILIDVYPLFNEGPSIRTTIILRKDLPETARWDPLEFSIDLQQYCQYLPILHAFSCLCDNQSLADSFAWYPDWEPRCQYSQHISFPHLTCA